MTTETTTFTPTDLADSTERLAISPTEDNTTVQDNTDSDQETTQNENGNHTHSTGTLHPLENEWSFWYDKRPAAGKRMRGEQESYENNLREIGHFGTVEDFWRYYNHMVKPSRIETNSNYHFFKEGIRPVWEDEENKRGGKWIMRLKKGVCDRYWEDLLLAMIGDQFYEAGEEVCGAVLSVRAQEDVFSIWTKNDGGRNIKIRETIKRALSLPSDTRIEWKSHDDSIAQRSAIDQARHEKTGHHGTEKRRVTLSAEEHSTPAKEKPSGGI